jgi:hypothetical protein
MKNALLAALRMRPKEGMVTLPSIKNHAALREALQYIKEHK